MKKIIAGLIVLTLSGVLSMQVSASGTYDLEVTNVELVPCYYEVDENDPLYAAQVHQAGDNNYISGQYRSYVDGDWGEGEIYENWEMMEVAPDESWFHYYEYDNNYFGTISHHIYCLAVDFTAEGDFAALGAGSDSVPTDWNDYFDYLGTRFKITAALIPSTGLAEHTLSGFYYQNDQVGFASEALEEENRIFMPLEVRDNSLHPGDSFDLMMAIDNDLNSKGFFTRTWFDNGTTHYNDGPRIPESDEQNNYLYLEDFIEIDLTHTAQPDIEMVSVDEDSFRVEWNDVPGIDHYVVRHLRDDITNISLTTEIVNQEQTETYFEAEFANSGNYLDCVDVTPVDANDLFGKMSERVCYGTLFSDVDADVWYTDYTHNALQNGIISGYTTAQGEPLGTFGPGDSITTSQALKMAATLNDRYVNESSFAFQLPYSIPANLESHWSSNYLLSSHILEYDLVEDINSFDPDRDITRAEMINLIMESMEVIIPEYQTYSLTDIAGHEYADEIELAYQLGIISGYGDTNTFGPDNSLLRAEAVKVFVESGHAFQLTWPGQDVA
ncbi:S-layer homology domain-containing protein [Patescibacteria group bacterium]|nr:S-layer homology domain-containing protein [Patescibacteria group bacterium]